MNNTRRPTAAFLWKKRRAWFLGSPTDPFITDLQKTLENTYFRILREHEATHFRLLYDERCSPILDKVLPDLKREAYPRSYYRLNARGRKWNVNPPTGIGIVEIDEDLLASNYGNLDRVKDETCSERDSVADFLEKSFGYAALDGDELVSWCMSEYNTHHRCELGIETIETHQRRGIATQVARAVIAHAIRQGVYDIGWHSWKRNEASVRTASRIGFEHALDYPIYEIKINTRR